MKATNCHTKVYFSSYNTPHFTTTRTQAISDPINFFSPIGVNPDNLLYITGHRLGAALTHLAMFTLNDAGWNISKTYSFEAPRIA